ncbi:modin [Colletotrichum limetticola]|uniref:Modin n=1 Tax=Colletotrichum limetticola TaxID=1209924 RepID=A0ABQ9QBC2_9PEZI|nr:modin [Colletotrichum limetticola]
MADSNSSNSPSDNSNSNGNANGGSDVVVAIVALVVSVVALFAATLQIMQAIFASAKGLPNCTEDVMGGWAKGTTKRPKFKELRLEVRFEAPIIFLAPPNNQNKPEKGEMWSVEGTEKSCTKNRLEYAKIFPNPGPANGTNDEKPSKPTEKVHTVNNELATWVYLLIALERMEKDSKEWECKKLQGEWLPSSIIPDLPEPTLSVKVQAKERSFDANPSIKKPYATSTISHLVELAAILGLYWRVFDRDNNQYRAEGNGYSLTGSRVPDLGVVFVFEKTGPTVFEERRVIPTSEVKELCFGRVPTFYRVKKDPDEDLEWQREFKMSSGTGTKVEILQLSTRDAIAETLTQIGCNGKTTLFYREGKKDRHLFSVTFEVIGMLARVLHIEGRCFRFLPNPTIFSWDRDSLSLQRLLIAFSGLLMNDLTVVEEEAETVIDERVETAVEDIRALSESAEEMSNDFDENPPLTSKRMSLLHKAIDVADKSLKKRDQGIVLDVLRRHLQEVLAAINSPDKRGKEQISFRDLLGIPLEMREQRFMETYFERILWRVVPTNSTKRGKRDDEVVSRAIHDDTEKRRSRLGNGSPQAGSAVPPSPLRLNPRESPTKALDDSTPTPGISRVKTWPHRIETEQPGDQPELPQPSKLSELPQWETIVPNHIEMQRLAIWYTLVFRMICWLMLHDFDKKDVQVSKIDPRISSNDTMTSSSEQPAALEDGRRIYLGNLLYSIQPVDIEEMLKDNGFEGYEKIHISMDPVSARNPGYCFVDFAERADAERALSSLDARLRGRPLKVGPCEPKKQNRSRWQSDRESSFNRWGDWSGSRGEGGDEAGRSPARNGRNGGIESGPYGAIKHFDEVVATEGDGRRLYVGGLGAMVDQAQHQDELQQILEGHKPLAISKRITPHESTRAKGGEHHYCFVDFATAEEADAARNTLDRKVWGTGRLRVNVARGLPDKLKDRTTPSDVQNEKENGERSAWRKPRYENSNRDNSARSSQPLRSAASGNWRQKEPST